MRNYKPTTFITSFFLSFVCIAIFFLTACDNNKQPDPISESIQNYVYAYTNGIVSKDAKIRVRFTNAIAPSEKVGELAPDGIIRFTPKLEGKAIWENDHTILYIPEKGLQSDKQYIAKVFLAKLFDNLPVDAQSFEFGFTVRPQDFTVALKGLQAVGNDNINTQILTGTIQTNDAANLSDIQKIVSANQGDRILPVTWEPNTSNRIFTFQVNDIKRKKAADEVTIKWDGTLVKIKNKGKQNVSIPAIGDFKVTNVQVLAGQESPYLQLQFSDPILTTQNLEGLIRIKGQKTSPDLTVNGNIVNVYPRNTPTGEQEIEISPGILNVNNQKMPKASLWKVYFESLKPKVRLVTQGGIIPDAGKLIFPFEAVSLNAVEVEIFKVFNNNILQFLQTNDLNGDDNLQQVGRVVLRKKVLLENLNPEANSFSWTRYAVDLATLFKADKNAIYQVRIGFLPDYITYPCNGSKDVAARAQTVSNSPDSDTPESMFDSYYGLYGYYDGYRWSHRDDPCELAYYNSDHFVTANLLSSDLGIMAKGSDEKQFFVAITSLQSAMPIPEAKVEFFDFQQQSIRVSTTDADGIVRANLDRKPAFIVATAKGQKGYLSVLDGKALSLSRYDVSGAVVQQGLKGFIYGERGVWRPGDSLYLNFILADEAKTLPDNHPVNFELIDPRGQVREKIMAMGHIDHLYAFHTKTDPQDPTGKWLARVTAGGAVFEKILKIETVKPNRLKIKMDFEKEVLRSNDLPRDVYLQVNWLHGAPAKGLSTKVEMDIQATKTAFENYNNYEFDDPARSLSSRSNIIFDGKTDNSGQVVFELNNINKNVPAPGHLMMNIKTRAFETGGDFSTAFTKVKYSPYNNYVGVKIPVNKYNEKRLPINEKGRVEFVVLNENGKPVPNRQLDIGLYRLNWRWWWDSNDENLSQYNKSTHFNATETLTTTTGKDGTATWSYTPDSYGRYMVRVCDQESGHCTGDFFYSGYPYREDNMGQRQQAAMIALSADEDKYQVGEKMKINVPASENSRILVTVENGSSVVESFWKEGKKGENEIAIPVTKKMAPNVYVHVTLLQKYGQNDNDLPIRMYGVLPLTIDDPATRLNPEIAMPDKLAPEEKFTIKVSEENKKAMAYTVAIVDDGLLDLTGFSTPDPHASLYAREALGIQTWDIYDHVLGASAGEISRVLSIGGDGVAVANRSAKNANRFKPVVRHLGPFYLEAGKTATHSVTMPNYVGSVRAMVVAANSEGMYGNAQQTVPVKKPLMLLATLPRTLTPGATLRLPVTLFAMEKEVKNIAVSVSETSGIVNLIGGNKQSTTVDAPGEKMVYFDLDVGERTGVAQFEIKAASGSHIATQTIEIQVDNPNPYVSNVIEKIVPAGENWSTTFDAVGMQGTNSGTVEISNIPPIDLSKRMNYLLQYPHGCIEQTTSAAFPQLFVNQLIPLNDKQRSSIPKNIKAAVQRIQKFQTVDGGFSYWPGQDDYSSWGTNYAGHFLLEANELGYAVPTVMMEQFFDFQKKKARQWSRNENNDNNQYSDLIQAYRLYTLAKGNHPELGAMNRMRELKNLSIQAKWRLAAAYALTGKKEVATQITEGLNTNIEQYRQLSYTYGSDLRDEAMILETLLLLNEETKAAGIVKRLSMSLSADEWLSTQTTAYALLSIAKFAAGQKMTNEFAFDLQIGNQPPYSGGATTPIMSFDLPVDQMNDKVIEFTNTSGGVLYVQIILNGQPATGAEVPVAENLNMEVQYLTMDGKPMEVADVVQGTDFVAEVKVTHPGTRGINYKEMALTQVFPAGWEIINGRINDFQSTQSASPHTYRDFRDDRVNTYFDLSKGATKTYRIQINAAYIGRYYLPAVKCEAMYDNTIQHIAPGQWVEVRSAEAG